MLFICCSSVYKHVSSLFRINFYCQHKQWQSMCLLYSWYSLLSFPFPRYYHVITTNNCTLLSVVLWHRIFYSLQHGFRKSRSCETQFIGFIDDVSIKTKKTVHRHTFLIMDFSKAFDNVNHSLLTHKYNNNDTGNKSEFRGHIFNKSSAYLWEQIVPLSLPILSYTHVRMSWFKNLSETKQKTEAI